MRKIIAAFFVLFIAGPCAAQPNEEVIKAMEKQTSLTAEEIREDYDACGSGVIRRMAICASYGFFSEDVRLNHIYRKARASAKEGNFDALLIRSQRAWLAYRDESCELEASVYSGQGIGGALDALSCKGRLTKDRADYLKELIEK